MVLHTLSASPASPAFDDCLRLLAREDAVLLMGDGVYAALAGTPALESLLRSGATVHLLQADAAAAGILEAPAGTKTVDMEGFVALTERYARQLAWY
jgi:tRNA 2-thiouridine synthesizing protein B